MKFLISALGAFAVLQLTAGSTSGEFGPIKFHSVDGHVNAKTKLTNRDKLASEKAIANLEFFRRFIETGVWTVPIVDPFKVQELRPVPLNHGKLSIKNYEVRGGKKGTVNDIKLYLDAKRVEYDISVPELAVKFHFDAVEVFDGCITFNVSSDVTLTLTNFRATGALSVHPNPRQDVFVLDGLDSTIQADKVKYDFSTKFACLNDIGKNILQGFSDSATTMAKETLDRVLLGFSREQVIKFVEPEQLKQKP